MFLFYKASASKIFIVLAIIADFKTCPKIDKNGTRGEEVNG